MTVSSPGSASSSQDDIDGVRSTREEQGLIVLVSVITSCLQTLHSCDSKLAALELVLHLAPRLAVDILLDRITPYLLHFCSDHMPRVRAQAVRTLTRVLALVKEVPRNDVNIYPEYILPGIAHLAQDDATIVRLAYAGQLGLRLQCLLKYFTHTHENMLWENIFITPDGIEKLTVMLEKLKSVRTYVKLTDGTMIKAQYQ